MLEGIYWGIGSGVGALIGGFLYDGYGAVRLFEISAILSLISMILSFLVSILETRSHVSERDDYSQVTQNTLIEEHDYVKVISTGDIELVNSNHDYVKVISTGDIELVNSDNQLDVD